MDLFEGDYHQADLFTQNQSLQSLAMMEAFDNINARYGKGALFVGAQGTQRNWSMSRNLKSPNYTTRNTELPVITL